MPAKLMLFITVLILTYVFATKIVAISKNGIAEAKSAEITSAPPWDVERTNAVTVARRGDTVAALAVLERLTREHPQDMAILRDFTVITAWAGQDLDAIRLFASLPPTVQPDYVIEAVALAHRHVGQPA